jgi:POT family proton-dependent oligopeptide transporter
MHAAAEANGAFGHPKGLYYLAFTEAWERFSYFGMVSLLVLYMVDQLLLPGHAERVAALSGLRTALESFQGPLSSQAFASQIYGLYTGLVYFTPIIGGAIGDRWIGQRSAVVIGALLMAAGHIAMAFDLTFLLALLLLIVGSGFLKGNIAAQVGALYPPADETRRARGYMIFMAGISAGALVGPLLCGLLAELYGWHYGFGVAALFMLIGLATYLYGYRHLPKKVARPRHGAARLTPGEWRAVRALIVVILISTFQSVTFYQMYNAMVIWTQQYVAATVWGFRMPVPWYQAISSLGSILGVPLLFWLWRMQAARGHEPHDLEKIGTGAWLSAASSLVLVAAIFVSRGAQINPIWPFLCVVGLGVGWLYQWPILFALVSQAAPANLKATLMGITYLSLFVSAILVGWIGGFYERISPAAFWALHAAIAAAGGLFVWLLGGRLARALQPA